MKVGVLFVCLGNICRSPMAEAVFRHLVISKGLSDHIKIDSCGTGGWHAGEPPHEGTQEVLNRYQICYSGLTARKLRPPDFEEFDLIVPMDRDNEREILAVARSLKVTPPEMRLLLSFAEDRRTIEVPDPYYTGEFDRVYDLVTDGCNGLLTWCEERIGSL